MSKAGGGAWKGGVRVGEWFAWNGSVNPEKGTAAGSVHVEPPISSPLGRSAAYFAAAAGIAYFPVTAVVGVGVCAYLGVHELRRWTGSLPSVDGAVQRVQHEARAFGRDLDDAASAIARDFQAAAATLDREMTSAAASVERDLATLRDRLMSPSLR